MKPFHNSTSKLFHRGHYWFSDGTPAAAIVTGDSGSQVHLLVIGCDATKEGAANTGVKRVAGVPIVTEPPTSLGANGAFLDLDVDA